MIFASAEQITSGQIKVSAKYGIIPVYDSTLDLCDIADQAGLSCPLASGDHSLEITKNLPSLVPSVINVQSYLLLLSNF